MKHHDRDTAEGILFTDQYHLTSAQLYYRMGLHEKPAQFDYFFRSYPNYGDHQAGYCIFAGLEWLLDWMDQSRVRDQDVEYLRSQVGSDGSRLFADDFLEWFRAEGDFSRISLRAVPEGRVVHPNVPLAVVQGPLALAQILETPLLNHLNYQTLIATKAARMSAAGRGRPLFEFGLRRAPERGGNAATRAALIGGADFSSNVGVSHLMGFQPKGTHAHSLVQVFMALGEGELGAFRAYADVYPDDCLVLVDTVDTLGSGVPNAITVFEELRSKGHVPRGIRLDSGDLAYLAIQSAAMLDGAGFPDTSIVLSSGLDELAIWQIITQIEEEAPRYGVDADRLIGRLVYGVGTSLVNSGSFALDGVYKASAIRIDESWRPMLKVSETPAKTINPGEKRIWRVYDSRRTATVDVLAMADEEIPTMERVRLRHPVREELTRALERRDISSAEPLLVDILREGRRVADQETVEQMRGRRRVDLERLDSGVRRLINPHIYHVSLTEGLWALKQRLVAEARGKGQGSD
ncbi:MAG: nicotinate phosphoribosyltransferase [Acidobacteriota bacterium]|nr:nicotinate phosphoribosyltransferase [Acidobacteriota bacterium]